MAKEIERKFLVANVDAAISEAVTHKHIVQGYLSTNPDATVRVRIADTQGFLAVKSRNHGAERNEWEYEIPHADALEMLKLSQSRVIDKTRYLVPFEGFTWEVDLFHSHPGLALAEVELPGADTPISLPAWIGQEVTDNPAYYNSALSLK